MHTPERQALIRWVEMEKVWGHGSLGLALTHAFRNDTGYSTLKLVELTGLSRATVQNHLRVLLNVGRVVRFESGREVSYAATDVWADRTSAMLRSFVEDGLHLQPI
jgi:DNA-binding transcriptional ArsR family regulator